MVEEAKKDGGPGGEETRSTPTYDDLEKALQEVDEEPVKTEEKKTETEETKGKTEEGEKGEKPPEGETAGDEDPPLDPKKLKVWLAKRDGRLLAQVRAEMETRYKPAPEKEPSLQGEEGTEPPDQLEDPEGWLDYMLQQREEKARKRQGDYSGKFTQKLVGLLTGEPDAEEIEREFFRKDESGKFIHNLVYRGDPELDAEFRLTQARASLYSRKASGVEAEEKKRSEFKGKQERSEGTAITTPTETRGKSSADIPVLDEASKEYVKYLEKEGVDTGDLLKRAFK